MSVILAVALGGAAGAVLRYGLSHGLHQWLGHDFPYGTAAANVLGCFVAGILYMWLLSRGEPMVWRALLLVGFLGAFTTFSAFSLETLALAGDGHLLKAVANVLLSVILSLGACWLGLTLARPLVSP
jgi:fluoride exporter